jgi:hypothetical protein
LCDVAVPIQTVLVFVFRLWEWQDMRKQQRWPLRAQCRNAEAGVMPPFERWIGANSRLILRGSAPILA